MERLLFLKSIPLLHTLSLEQLQALQGRLVEETFAHEEVIYSKGERGGRLYFIREGSVELVQPSQTQPQFTFTAGEHFGELALFDDWPRETTALAKERSVLLSLSFEQYRSLVTQCPELLFPLTQCLAARLRALLR